MTPVERRLRTEVRYWSASVGALVALVGAASARVGITAIAFCIVAVVCLWQAHKLRAEVRRLNSEADRAEQEEWT